MTGEKIVDTLKWTNDEYRWRKLGHDKNKNILWHINDERDSPRYRMDQLPEALAWDQAQKIFIVECEGFYARENVEFDPRIILISPAGLDHPRHRFFPWWYAWQQQVELCVNHRSKLSEDTNRPYVFDALLGSPWSRKKWVAEKIKNCDRESKFLWSIGVPWNGSGNKEAFIPGHDLHRADLATSVVYNDKGHTCNNGLLMPWKIYNKSWFSIISETEITDDLTMLTEKSGNCLSGKRLFINFGTPGVLSSIRQMGFKTFDCIIDESYDTQSDQEIRFQKAWNQVNWLLDQDPLKIYKEVEHILSYNQELFLSIDHEARLLELLS